MHCESAASARCQGAGACARWGSAGSVRRGRGFAGSSPGGPSWVVVRGARAPPGTDGLPLHPVPLRRAPGPGSGRCGADHVRRRLGVRLPASRGCPLWSPGIEGCDRSGCDCQPHARAAGRRGHRFRVGRGRRGAGIRGRPHRACGRAFSIKAGGGSHQVESPCCGSALRPCSPATFDHPRRDAAVGDFEPREDRRCRSVSRCFVRPRAFART